MQAVKRGFGLLDERIATRITFSLSDRPVKCSLAIDHTAPQGGYSLKFEKEERLQ
jgi:hypothetical protein